METNDSNNHGNDGQPQGAQTTSAPAQPPVIESASASTACQTNTSKTPYVVTGVVLGVLALIAVAITLLAFTVLRVSLDASSSYSHHYEDYNEGYDLDDFQDELDQFERDLERDLGDRFDGIGLTGTEDDGFIA